MPVPRIRIPTVFPAVILACAGTGFALEGAAGVNLTASEPFGARSHGFALVRAGFQNGAEAVANAPASMNDVNDFTFSTAHAEQFGMARFDNFSVLVPWHARGTFGFGLARYSVSGVERQDEEAGLPTAEPEGLFSTSDLLLTGSFARRFGGIDVGGSVHLLSRQLDQSGFGLRADAMAQYTFDGRFRGGAHVRGLVPSVARWEEGHTEYEAPDLSLFAAGRWDLPYLYGTLQAGVETPGILQAGGRSAGGLEGERGVTSPGSLLATTRIGAEFTFDFGLSLRAGFQELAPSSWASSARLGMGYTWRNAIGVDYAFSAHPHLGESHRVALRLTPAFPKFDGRGFRPGTEEASPGEFRPRYPSPYEPGRPQDRDPARGADEEDDLEEGEILDVP